MGEARRSKESARTSVGEKVSPKQSGKGACTEAGDGDVERHWELKQMRAPTYGDDGGWGSCLVSRRIGQGGGSKLPDACEKKTARSGLSNRRGKEGQKLATEGVGG